MQSFQFIHLQYLAADCHLSDKRFFPHSEQTSDILSTIFFSGVLSWSHLQVLLLLTPRSTPQLSSWDPPFLSVLYFYGTHVLVFLDLFTHFVGVHLPITFQERLYGRYILKRHFFPRKYHYFTSQLFDPLLHMKY